MFSLIRNAIALNIKLGNKVKAIHFSKDDFEYLTNQSSTPCYTDISKCFGYPIIKDADYTHIELEEEDKCFQYKQKN